MPRLPPTILKQARVQHALLPVLLRTCRDLSSARNELRWLREHALAVSRSRAPSPGWRNLFQRMCVDRGRGRPLQYIIGTQPFGELDILCRKGVMIPRPETEEYVTRAAEEILNRLYKEELNRPLRILDLCTGTGCIPLLLHSLLSQRLPQLQILGVDVEQPALRLARRNLRHNVRLGALKESAATQVRFMKADVLGDASKLQAMLSTDRGQLDTWNVIISNPPYISPTAFNNGTTKRSVRNWEPKVALVPSTDSDDRIAPLNRLPSPLGESDIFYPHLLEIAENIGAKSLIMEVGETEQAERVKQYAVSRLRQGHHGIVEVWRDEGFVGDDGNAVGEGRAVVCWLGDRSNQLTSSDGRVSLPALS